MGIINTNNKQKKILEIVYPFKEHINTIRAWDAFRRLNPKLELPSSVSIKRDFKSWNNFKISLGLEINRPDVVNKKEEYIQLLAPHKEYLRTKDSWDEYIKLQTEVILPSGETLTKKFRTWNELKSCLGLENEWTLSKEEYIQLLTPYREHLITMVSWEAYRSINDEVELPDSVAICTEFENWENVKKALKIDYLKKEKLNDMLAPHICELNTMQQWDIYRQQYPELPNSTTLYSIFGGWDNIQNVLWDYISNNKSLIKDKNSALTKDEFINIVKHKKHLKTKAYWEAYRMKNPELNLLSSAVLANRFTSWNIMKNFFGIEASLRISISSLTEEECIKFLTPYKEHFTTVDDWVSFKKQNPNLRLPSKNTLLRYFGTWNIMKEKLGLDINQRTDMILLPKEEYLKLLTPYKEHLQTRERWNKFRAEHPELKLPACDALTICCNGSWFKVKKDFGVI